MTQRTLAAAAGPVPDSRPRASLARAQRRFGTAALAPAVVVLLLVLAWPIADSIWLSLHKVELAQGLDAQPFVGAANYGRLFASRTFNVALWNSIYFTVVEVAATVLLALGVALLLDHRLGRPAVFRLLLIVPWAIAPVANAVLWKWILNANYGVLNALLLQLGLVERPQVWLGSPRTALNMLLVVDVWKAVPFIALILLAGLQRIPPVLYRAARVDGARAWGCFRHVTLPGLRAPLAVAVVLQTLWSFRVFDLVYVLTRGGPADGTLLLNYLAYRETFNSLHLGYGAAVATVVFALMALLAAAYLALLRPGRQPA